MPETSAQSQPGPRPIGELLAYHAGKDPARPALTFGETTIGYADLDARSNRKARQLAALGVGQDDVVTIALPKSLEYYETLFGLWKLGATPNNVSSRLPAAELRAIVDLAEPKLVVADESIRVGGREFLAAGTPVGPEFQADPLPGATSSRWKIMTSGGSTGRPKLIVDRLPGLFDPEKPAMWMRQGETILNPGPLYHNTPFVASFYCLFNGGHVVELEKFDPLRTLELIERHKIGWVSLVPTMMSRIWRLPEEERNTFDVSSLRVVLHMGAVCPVWLKQAWIEWLGPEKILEVYGGSEVMGVTFITGSEWLEHKGSVGRPVGARMRIFDERGKECPAGEIGEIYFLPDKGANTTYQYIGAKAKSLGDWQSYGDLGHVDEDGFLYIADRRTDMIVSGGANIFPAEVEASLEQHPDVRVAVVVGLPDNDLGQRAHAIIQASEEARARIDADDLRAFLSDRLVRYKIPRTFEFTGESLRDEAGKVRRSRLRDERAGGTAAAGSGPATARAENRP